MDVAPIIVLIISIACCLPVSYFLGRMILNPLVENRAKAPHVQFLITDIYALILQTMGIGAIFFGVKTEDKNQMPMLIGTISAAVLLAWWWWMGVRKLSRAGVRSAWRRAVFLTVAVPFAFGNFFMLSLPIPAMVADADAGNSDRSGAPIGFLFYFLLVLYMVFAGCRSLALWAAAPVEEKY